MASRCTTIRISALSLLSEPETYHHLLSHPQDRAYNYSKVQITFDTPTHHPGFTTPMGQRGQRARMPHAITTIEFRFQPAVEHPYYMFEPLAFFKPDAFLGKKSVILTFPYLSPTTHLGSSIRVNRVLGQFSERATFGRVPFELHLKTDSWSNRDYSSIPSIFADLIAVFGKQLAVTLHPTFAPESFGTLTISLPRNQQAHAALIRDWKYSHFHKRPIPTVLNTSTFGLFNTTADSTSLFIFLANLLPYQIDELLISPLSTRPSFQFTRRSPIDGYQHQLWSKENSITDMDLTIFDVGTWQRDESGDRIKGLGHNMPYTNTSAVTNTTTGISGGDKLMTTPGSAVAPSREAQITEQVMAYLEYFLQVPPKNYKPVQATLPSAEVQKLANDALSRLVQSGTKVLKMSGEVALDVVRRAVVEETPGAGALGCTLEGERGLKRLAPQSQKRLWDGTTLPLRKRKRTSSDSGFVKDEDLSDEDAMVREPTSAERAVVNKKIEKTATISIPADKITNAYPGERQAWTSLTRLVVGIDHILGLRKVEEESLKNLHEARCARRSQVAVYTATYLSMRQNFLGEMDV